MDKFEEHLLTNTLLAVSREFGVPVNQLLHEDKSVALVLIGKMKEVANLCRDMHEQGYMKKEDE